VPESPLKRVGLVIGIVTGVVGILVGIVGLWLAFVDRPSKGPAKFEKAAGSIDEIAEFDGFITENTGKRVHLSVTFPNNATIRVGKESPSANEFVVGDVRCDPAKVDFCEHRYGYRVFGLRKNDSEALFGWIDGGDGWLLRGAYFVNSGVGTGGIQWRALQAVHNPAP
jgi:hypothetical protein